MINENEPQGSTRPLFALNLFGIYIELGKGIQGLVKPPFGKGVVADWKLFLSEHAMSKQPDE